MKPESEHALADLRDYYSAANADPDFRRALATLHAEVRPGPRAPSSPPAACLPKLAAFARRWGLPFPRGIGDLWCSLRAEMRQDLRPLQPKLGRRTKSRRSLSSAVDRLLREGRGAGRRAGRIPGPRLMPRGRFIPDPKGIPTEIRIEVDPEDPLGSIDRGMGRLRQKRQRLADELKAQGWRAAAARRGDVAERMRMADRLWKRAAHRTPWQDLLDGQSEETRAVRLSVERWAKRLGVPLPDIFPGRPRAK